MRQWFLFFRHRRWNFLRKALFRDKLCSSKRMWKSKPKWQSCQQNEKRDQNHPGIFQELLVDGWAAQQITLKIYICSWLRRDRKTSRSQPPCHLNPSGAGIHRFDFWCGTFSSGLTSGLRPRCYIQGWVDKCKWKLNKPLYLHWLSECELLSYHPFSCHRCSSLYFH